MMSGMQKRPAGGTRPRDSTKPLRAFVLIEILPGRVAPIVRALERIEVVREVDTVTGPYDIVVHLELEDLGDVSRSWRAPSGG